MKVRPVNLELLQRRIRLEEQGSGSAGEKGSVLALLGRPTTGENVWADLTVTSDVSEMTTPVVRRESEGGPYVSALRLAADEQLLLITSRYRFLLITARQLADMREVGLGIEDIHRFAAREAVVAVVNWSAAREMERLLLVTSTGYVRAYPLDTLRPAIEAPAGLTFDHPPPGVPVLAQGVDRGMDVIIVTEGGRAVRWPLANVPLAGVQALNPGPSSAIAVGWSPAAWNGVCPGRCRSGRPSGAGAIARPGP